MPRGEGAVRARASLTDCTVNMNMTGYCMCADESTRRVCANLAWREAQVLSAGGR